VQLTGARAPAPATAQGAFRLWSVRSRHQRDGSSGRNASRRAASRLRRRIGTSVLLCYTWSRGTATAPVPRALPFRATLCMCRTFPVVAEAAL